tara:strand:+ start:35 stop:565 length:531 start_codon:yes stop_codon:yes gene_type:complete
MAKLGIRDKNYFPNQYINPMLISGREPNREDAPYRIFDKTNPEHPDYEGNKDEEGDVQLELDLALRPDQVRAVTSSGMFIGPRNEVYGRNSEGVFTPQGKFDNKIHGNIVPKNLFSRANRSMMIAKKKKRNEQRAYEDFVKDSQGMGITESFKDLRRGQDGEGFDILHDLLDLDEV